MIMKTSLQQVQEELAIRKTLLSCFWKLWTRPLWCALSGRTNYLWMIRENMVKNSSHLPWREHPFKAQPLWQQEAKPALSLQGPGDCLGQGWGRLWKSLQMHLRKLNFILTAWYDPIRIRREILKAPKLQLSNQKISVACPSLQMA